MAEEEKGPAAEQPMQQMTATITLSARIPEFWRQMPRLWFHQFDAIVDPQKTGDVHKSQLLIAKLGRDELRDISDILENMPVTGKFETLKKRLISVYEQSETQQLNQLLNEVELGDQKPSQLLRRMRELGKNRVPDETLKVLWVGRLPRSIRAVITACDVEIKLDNLAITADKIMESTKPHELALINQPSDTLGLLAQELNTMKLEIQAINTKLKSRESRDHSRHTQRGTSRTRSRPRDNSNSRFQKQSFSSQSAKPGDGNYKCFYHFVYGKDARKCGDIANCRQITSSEN